MKIDKQLTYVDGPYGRLATNAINFADGNRSRVIMAHGFSGSNSMVEHAKLFMETAEALAAHDIGSLLFDFTGNGNSDGYFHEMTPNRRIAELVTLIDLVAKSYEGKIFLLGLSMGGAVSIHAASQRQDRLSGLVTWSCVPSFALDAPSAHWFPPVLNMASVERVGPDFYTDRPTRSIAETYQTLTLPKLQIQGDRDLMNFASEFKTFFDAALEPKRRVLIEGGDHVFTDRLKRSQVIDITTQQIQEWCH